MTLFRVNLNEIVGEAAGNTDFRGPETLIAAFSKMSDPFSCENQGEQLALNEAHQADLGPVYRYASLGRPLAEDDKGIWIDRIAWLLASMKKARSERLDKAELIAMLRTAAAFQRHGSLWNAIPEIYYSAKLLDYMSAIVRGIKCSLDVRSQNTPIWEREAVDAFKKAENTEDWPAIENAWQAIVSPVLDFHPYDDLCEAAKCLSATEHGHTALAEALDQAESLLSVAMVGDALHPTDIAKVALNSRSNLTRFTLIQTFAFDSRRNVELEVTVIDNLAEVFRSIQSNHSEWGKWMQALNRYPGRTRVLQPAMGTSMVGSSENVKATYIDAIDLHGSFSDGREAVSSCFEVFRNKSERNERESMWRLCYQRWSQWEFGRVEDAHQLTCIALSELDYGVIGYFVECLSDDEFSDELTEAHGALSTCQDKWHKDHISFNDAWFRSLSVWQALTYASGARTNKPSWELPNQVYLPFDPAKDRYATMTLDTHLPHGFSSR